MLRNRMVLRSSSLCAALLLVACKPADTRSASCLELPPAEGPAVARVGDVAITVHQMAMRVRAQGTTAVKRYEDRQRLRTLVEDQIRIELLVRAALERGLAYDPDVIDAARKVMVRKLLARDLGPGVFAGDVSDEAVAEYYQQHLDDYQQPEKVRLAHILLPPTAEGRARARALIGKLQARPTDRELFRRYVVQSSLDAESKSTGGELLFKSRDELTEQYGSSFATDVFQLPPNETAPEPVQSTRGWHIVRVLARRDILARSLDEVRGEIREKLMKGQRAKDFDKYLDEIRQRHPVALYEDRLDAVIAEARAAPEVKRP